MNISAATLLAGWAVFTAWLVLFVVIEHFDDPGPDFLDYVQWGTLAIAAVFFPFFRKRFAKWLEKQRGT